MPTLQFALEMNPTLCAPSTIFKPTKQTKPLLTNLKLRPVLIFIAHCVLLLSVSVEIVLPFSFVKK